MKHNFFISFVWVLVFIILGCGVNQTATPMLTSTIAVESDLSITTIAPPSPTLNATSTPQPSLNTQAGDAAFASILERVKQSDPTVDFTEFRLSYAQTSQYDPYNFNLAELRQSMVAALKDKNYELAIKYADEILAQNYIFPDAHLVKNRAYESLGQSDKALYHRYVLNGLIESMLQSGDGKSPESAFVVVLIDEESVILNVLNVKQGEQASTDIDGHSYDIIDGVNLTTGNSIKVYFNIDIPFGVLIKSLQP